MFELIMPLPTVEEPDVERSFDCDLPEAGATDVTVNLCLSCAPGAPVEDGPPKRLLLEGEILFTAEGECSRCLEPARQEVQSCFTTLLDLDEGTSEDVDLETPPEPSGVRRLSEALIDVAEEVQQRIELARPAILYCRSNCRGLCPRCGANLNEKPCGCSPAAAGEGKFAVLAALLERKT